MAFTEQNKADAYLFFVLAFNAAPGTVYGGQIVEAYESGMTTADIVAQYVEKPAFTSQYPTTQTANEFATALVNNVASSGTTAAVKASAVADIETALAAGWTKAQVVTQILGNLANKTVADADWGQTVAQLSNKIAVAKVLSEGDKALSTEDAGLLSLAKVTHELSTVDAALNAAGDLASKLEKLSAAEKAASDYVESLELGATVKTLADAETAVKADADTASIAVLNVAAKTPAGTTKLSSDAATKAAQIQLAQANAAADVKSSAKALTDYQAALAKVIDVDGVSALTVIKNANAAAAAKAATADAAKLAANALVKADADLDVGGATLAYTPPATAAAYAATIKITYTPAGGGAASDVAAFDVDKKAFVFASGLSAADKAKFTAVLNAANADYQAKVADEAAAGQVTDADDLVTNFTPAGTVTFATAFADVKDAAGAAVTAPADADAAKAEVDTLVTDAADAKTAQADLVENIATVSGAAAILAQLEKLGTNIESAEKAFTDAGYEVPEKVTGSLFASDKDDVFLVTKDSNASSILGFAGKDVLYVGAGYELGAGLAAGSDTKLEVFFKANGSSTDVYVEQKAFGSSSADTTGKDIVKITLTGVAADKLV